MVSPLTCHVLLHILDVVLQDLRLEDHGLGPSIDHLGNGIGGIVHLKTVHFVSIRCFLLAVALSTYLALNHEDDAVVAESSSRTYEQYFLILILL